MSPRSFDGRHLLRWTISRRYHFSRILCQRLTHMIREWIEIRQDFQADYGTQERMYQLLLLLELTSATIICGRLWCTGTRRNLKTDRMVVSFSRLWRMHKDDYNNESALHHSFITIARAVPVRWETNGRKRLFISRTASEPWCGSQKTAAMHEQTS